jgi:branched-chain amino acid transport system substrate-binding protein
MFDDETVKLILPYAAKKLNVSKLAVLAEVSDLGTSLASSIKRDWARLGKDVTVEESFQARESNFRPSLLKMMSAKPDAIYNTSSNGKVSAQIVRQARDLGYEGLFLSYGAFEDPEVLALGAKAERCFYTSPKFDAASGSQETKDFIQGFTKKHSRPPNIHQANHYDLIRLYDAIVGKLAAASMPATGENFKKEFTSAYKTYSGAAGNYRFDFSDGSVLRSTVVKTVKDGAFAKVEDLD